MHQLSRAGLGHQELHACLPSPYVRGTAYGITDIKIRRIFGYKYLYFFVGRIQILFEY
jgi:hypothetical protein